MKDTSCPDGRSEPFTYDPVGNRTHLGGAGSTPTDYTYGPVNRLLSSAATTGTNSYTYDAARRLVEQVVNGQERAFSCCIRFIFSSFGERGACIVRSDAKAEDVFS